MNIKHVEVCDFRRSELTNFMAVLHHHPELKKLGKRDIVMLVNLTKTQIVMIMGFFTTNVKGMAQTKYIRSEKIRMLEGEQWNPLRVADYAARAGIPITNFHLLDTLKNQVEEIKQSWQLAA